MFPPTPEEMLRSVREKDIYDEKTKRLQVVHAVETIARCYWHLQATGIKEKDLEYLVGTPPHDIFEIAGRMDFACRKR